MYKGTTPTYIFTNNEVDLTQATKVYVTFSDGNGNEIVTKSGDDLTVEEHSVSVWLSQAETLSFPNGRVAVQINWTYNEENKVKRACSEKMTITANKNLIDEVI